MRDGPVKLWCVWVVALAVGALAFVAYAPALRAGFCLYDDPAVLLGVNGYRGLAWENIRWMFTTTHMGHYQPLTWLSYAVDHELWGMQKGLRAEGFHLTNVLLHALNAGLVYAVARRLIAAGVGVGGWMVEAGAVVAALVFGVHPLRVESVAWITERRDVLSSCFLLLAGLAYLRAFGVREAGVKSWGWYAASVALLGVSLLCKAWGMSFFVIMLVVDWYPLRRMSWAAVVQKAPYAVLGVAALWMAGVAQHSSAHTVVGLERWGIGERLGQALYGLSFYVQKTMWPVGLGVLHQVPRELGPVASKFAVGAVFTVTGALLVVALRKRAPALVAAAVVYAVVLAPVLGFMQSGPQLVADRYSYVANIGWAVAIGGGLSWWARRDEVKWRSTAAVGVVVLAILGALTWRQTWIWQDSARLFRHSIDVGCEGPIIRELYGQALSEKGRKEEALAQFKLANELDAEYSFAWFSRANAEEALGRLPEAEASYKRARELMHDSWRADLMLGMMYMNKMERLKDAEACFRAAVANAERQPPGRFSSRPYLMLAAALDIQGDEKASREWLAKAAKFEETRAEAERVLKEMGK